MNAIDIGLLSNTSYDYDMNPTTFNDCISRTRRTSDSEPKLLIKLSTGYNDLLPYSHKDKIIVDGGNDDENVDVLYCGCEHYPCKTIIYSLNRTDLVAYFLFTYILLLFFFYILFLILFHF